MKLPMAPAAVAAVLAVYVPRRQWHAVRAAGRRQRPLLRRELPRHLQGVRVGAHGQPLRQALHHQPVQWLGQQLQ